jgi:hypothetical protein
MTESVARPLPVARRADGGPHPGALTVVTAALFVASVVVVEAATGGSGASSPTGTSAADVAARYADHPDAFRVSALLAFGASVPLAILAATLYTRQRRLGIRVPGPAIGLVGGVLASALLAVSTLATWTAAQDGVPDDAAVTRALALRAFSAGGVGFAVGLGLLVAGAAVPALILHLVPRWLAWAGLVLAAIAEISFLSLVVEPLQYLLPVARFGGLLWLVAYAFLVPRSRHQVPALRETGRAAA